MGLPMLVDLCRAGKLKLDELLTGRYPFPKINETYEALDQGKELRSIVTF
jgi:S-(hydroxymethyl)glutathione dehydrogenase/alcohol dehydrogenase